ncbi:hypothetical protein KDU71_12490 [Carboxylicivirga sediminis]|uniref:Uncharacterized protein n=1 Tax=Carboxylicivirga sediminis TaxID=2006564 RepID=A0A941IZ26_9BACT|nr:hypothetical protein [Carboxylicivirga sediminis]MBR8536382.1 hypothetical protein [Carboxylicivirga sediminis]
MNNTVNLNYGKSSNLIFIVAGLIFFLQLVVPLISKNEVNPIYLVVINILLVGGVGFLVRQGYKWTKYFTLLLLVLYLIEVTAILTGHITDLTTKVASVSQLLLLTWATIILFVNLKKKVN